MFASVRAMFSGIVDYAGMFPPAQLSLEQSIRNYARYRTEPERWMLGRFVCPAARLAELSPFVEELFRDGQPLVISAVASFGSNATDIHLMLKSDVSNIQDFHRRHSSRAIVSAFEAIMPLARWDRFRHEMSLLRSVFNGNSLRGTNGVQEWITYYEVGFTPGWRTELDLLQKATIQNSPYQEGIKIRCAGWGPGMVLPAEDIANAINACQAVRLPLKFTAGLHHPVRHWDEHIQRYAHGFLNVFVAGVLNHAHARKPDELIPILEEENPSSFVFDSEGLSWRDQRATNAEIESARRLAVTSFGSCSFDEPRDGLRALGLIP